MVGFRLAGIALSVCSFSVVAALPNDASSQTENYGYDALGRLVSVNRSDGTAASYTYDPAGNRSQVVMLASSVTPGGFDLGNPVSVASGAWAVSAAPVITGITAPVAVSIAGGQYRINGGAWTTASGMISAGQTVQVQVQAPATGGASQTGTLTVGGVSDSFQVTALGDIDPDAPTFQDIVIHSNEPDVAWVGTESLITGINQPVVLRIERYGYSGNLDGAWIDYQVFDASNAMVDSGSFDVTGSDPSDLRYRDITVENGYRVKYFAHGTTNSGARSATWGLLVWRMTGTQVVWSQKNVSVTVDADNNHNVADYTLDPVDWSNLSETSSSTNFVTSGAGLPLNGINRNISLRGTITGLSGNLSAGSRLEMWVNGVFRYHSTDLGNGSWAGGDFAPGENVQFVARAVSADGAQRSGSYTVTVQNITTGQAVDTFSVTQAAAAPDYTPDAFNDFTDQNAVTNDPTIWFGPAQLITGINRPITLRVERYNYSGNFDVIAVNVYRDSGAGWVHQGSFDPRNTAGYQYVDFTVNNGDKIHYAVDARTTEGRKTGSMNMVVWNLSQPGGSVQLSSRNANMTVDNDNNFNVPAYTLDPISMPTLSVVSNENSAWTNTGVIAVAGINRPVTLRFTRNNQWDNFAPGSTGTRRLFVYHSVNSGSSWNEHIIGGGAGAVLDVTVNSGDLLHIRTWFDTTTGRGESSFTGYITNLQTGAQLSSFNVSGVVDDDNNYNIGGSVAATDWPATSVWVNSNNGSSSHPNYVTGEARTISGLASGQTATLSLSGTVSGGDSALLAVNIVKNGVDQGQKLYSPAYSTSVDANYAPVTVQNGDQIAFKVIVNGDPADQFNPYVFQGKEMDVKVHAGPGGIIDTFGASGSYSDTYSNCGRFEICEIH